MPLRSLFHQCMRFARDLRGLIVRVRELHQDLPDSKNRVDDILPIQFVAIGVWSNGSNGEQIRGSEFALAFSERSQLFLTGVGNS